MTPPEPPRSQGTSTTLSGTPTAADWATARGERWRNQLSGMERMLQPTVEPLITALRLDAPGRIADVACGGGGTTLELARRAPAGSVVHGFDISPALIEAARRRVGELQPNVSFEVRDVSAPPAPAPHDRLFSRFGVMFFDEPAAAFAALAGWLAPGGRFAFGVWAAPSENVWMTTLRDVTAALVELPRVDPEAPGPFRYADSDKLLALLDAAGLTELEMSTWRGSLPVGGGLTPAEAADFAFGAFAAFGEQLAQAGDEVAQAGRRALTERFTEHVHDGVVRMAAAMHIVSGARR